MPDDLADLRVRVRPEGVARTSDELRRLSDNAARAERSTTATERAFGRATRTTDGFSRSVATLGGAFAALRVGRGVFDLANGFDTLQNRLRVVTDSEAELTVITEELLGVSNRTRTSLESTVTLYGRLALASAELGRSQAELLQFTESLNQAVVSSGAAATESRNAIIQLSQGIASGALRGDELRSVLEQLPIVADVIARQLGITRGQLRAFGAEGRITADVIIDAFLEQQEQIEETFGRTVPTISQSFEVLRNQATAFVGDISRQTGATRALSSGVLILSDNIDVVARAGAGLATVLGVDLARRAIPALTRAIARNPIGLLATGFSIAAASAIDFEDGISGVRNTIRDFVTDAGIQIGQFTDFFSVAFERGELAEAVSAALNATIAVVREFGPDLAAAASAVFGIAGTGAGQALLLSFASTIPSDLGPLGAPLAAIRTAILDTLDLGDEARRLDAVDTIGERLTDVLQRAAEVREFAGGGGLFGAGASGDDRDRQRIEGFRSSLLDLARAIDEVRGSNSDAVAQQLSELRGSVAQALTDLSASSAIRDLGPRAVAFEDLGAQVKRAIIDGVAVDDADLRALDEAISRLADPGRLGRVISESLDTAGSGVQGVRDEVATRLAERLQEAVRETVDALSPRLQSEFAFASQALFGDISLAAIPRNVESLQMLLDLSRELRNSQDDLGRETVDLNRRLDDQRGAFGALSTEQQKSSDSLEKLIERVRMEAATLGLSSEEAKNYRFEIEAARLANEAFGEGTERAAMRLMDFERALGGLRDAQRAEVSREAAQEIGDLILGIREEGSLLGLTNDERTRAIVLRQAEAAAAADQLGITRELIPELQRELDALEMKRMEVDALTARRDDIQSFSDALSDSLTSPVADFISGSQSASEAFENLLSDISRQALEFAFTNPLQGLLSGLFGGNDGSGGILGSLFGSANGNVFQGGQITPFQNGGVIGGPILFPLRNGIGLAGEAGPEAILPLDRDSQGRLGVRSEGGGPSQVVQDNRTFRVTFNLPGVRNVQDFNRNQRQIAADFESVARRS